MNVEFTEELESILNQLTLRFHDILKSEISKYLLAVNTEYSKVSLQFLEKLDNSFKSKLLKYELIFFINITLHSSNIFIGHI